MRHFVISDPSEPPIISVPLGDAAAVGAEGAVGSHGCVLPGPAPLDKLLPMRDPRPASLREAGADPLFGPMQGGGRYPLLQGAQPMPSHCPPDAKRQLLLHL